MAKLGIVFGCFDFIVTPDGDYVFLEVNEGGQFLFLEQDTNLPLLDCFSDFLLDGRADFVGHQGEAKIRYADVLDIAKTEIEQALTLHCTSPEAFSNDDRSLP